MIISWMGINCIKVLRQLSLRGGDLSSPTLKVMMEASYHPQRDGGGD